METLESIIQTAISSELKELHTCLPAIVTQVKGQLIDCQPTIKRNINGKLCNLPLLVNVPLRYIKTSIFSISVPIQLNDYVLVLFAERSIDTWLLKGGVQDPLDMRKHHLSDAFAFPMMYPNTEEIPSFDTHNLVIKTNSGKTQIIVNASEDIDIIGNVTLTGNLDMTGIITGEKVFNGADSDSHKHLQNTGDDFGAGGITGAPQ